MSPYVLVALALVAVVVVASVRRVTVYEHERAVRYRRGRLAGVLVPGVYWVLPRFTTIVKVDVRATFAPVPGQEVLTADGVGVKLSIAASYRVVDPARALTAVADYRTALYTYLQLALREMVGSLSAEALMASRGEMARHLTDTTAPKAAELGLELISADVKDIMFPGEMKKIFGQVVKARQEGLAALERARGETAALRNLANAAGLLEQRPALMQLRLLQSLGQTPGSTVVLGMGGAPSAIPLRSPPESAPERPLPPADEGDREA